MQRYFTIKYADSAMEPLNAAAKKVVIGLRFELFIDTLQSFSIRPWLVSLHKTSIKLWSYRLLNKNVPTWHFNR